MMNTVMAEIPLKGGEKILFIGNSFTELQGGLDEYVKRACAAGTPSVTISSARHIAWAQELTYTYSSTDAVQKIRTGGYDIVVLQGFNNAQDWPVGSKAQFFQAVRDFDKVIKESGARTVLFMHWAANPTAGWNPPAKYEADTKALAENYTTIGNEIGAPVVPCGLVWHDLTTNPPKTGLAKDYLYADDIHQNALGCGVNSFVFYAMLTHRSPVGVHYTYGDFKPDALMEKALQERAWKIIQQREPWAAPTTVDRASMRIRAVAVTALAKPMTITINGRTLPSSAITVPSITTGLHTLNLKLDNK
jgi:hypothetical protein